MNLHNDTRLDLCSTLSAYIHLSKQTRVQGIIEEKIFVRNAIGGLFDVFEPTYLQPALQKPEPAPNLSHLVFGPIEWRIHGGMLPGLLDPLTASFKELGES